MAGGEPAFLYPQTAVFKEELATAKRKGLTLTDYQLWTEDRMRQVIAKAVAKGVALEIQADSDFPKPAFLKLAKQMGAKFSFGSNNFDDKTKDLSRWFQAIALLDLTPADLWSPK